MVHIDKKEISKNIEKNEPIVITFKFISDELLMFFNSTLVKILTKMDHLFLFNSLVTILREIVVNALKANAKRLYFNKIGIDLHNPKQYEAGMKKFKQDIIGEFHQLEKELTASDFFVELSFDRSSGDLHITVKNNAVILPQELERIQLRISKATQYNDFSEAYAEIDDETEGAGLGIALTILLLKNMGASPAAFIIGSTESITETSITIPRELQPSSIVAALKDQILNKIEGIPTFPQNVLELQRLCSDVNSSIDEIADRITKDPALTTDVLKVSNSAGFFPGKRIEKVGTAVKTIGLKNVNAILMASSARRILNERFASYEQIWDHCNKTAFYARSIALMYKMHSIVEFSFTAGLLHDLGKIILLATDQNLVKQISKIMKNRKIITTTIMEEISIGISHSAIGGLISKKWNFPEYLIEAIANHHSPLNACKDFRDLVFTVYLANMLCGIEDRRYSYYYLDETVLERFDLADDNRIKEFHEKIKNRADSIK